eukprot:9162068-Alexandrium_andersonii.AAC.1
MARSLAVVRPYRGVPWQDQPAPLGNRGEFLAQASALRYKLVPIRDAVDVADRSLRVRLPGGPS